MNKYELLKEKQELRGTIYNDFVKSVNKNSIYKSILLRGVKGRTAFYECEPYDDAFSLFIYLFIYLFQGIFYLHT